MVANAADFYDRHGLIVGEVFLDFETTDGGGTDVITVIPPENNLTGLVVINSYGIVIEQFAGGTEDQGIVTFKDTASSPNTIGTLTPTDIGADAVNDIVVGTATIDGASTGDAVKVVAAETGITATITQ